MTGRDQSDSDEARLWDDLPAPDSNELSRFSREVREAYRWLFENRHDPQPMSRWVEQSREIFGKTNTNAGRRLRELYSAFEVKRYPKAGSREWVYELVRRLPERLDDLPITNRLAAEVFTVKGRWCAMCGRGPVDGVKLEIDHIVPREWGGQTVLENLEPLCAPHNQGKKAFFSTYDDVGPVISRAMGFDDPWTRIGELLKGFRKIGRPTPVELIYLVAKETHRGDPLKRLRELRYILGWPIQPFRTKDGDGVTHVSYGLTGPAPRWPSYGPAEAVRQHERERRAGTRLESRRRASPRR